VRFPASLLLFVLGACTPGPIERTPLPDPGLPARSEAGRRPEDKTTGTRRALETQLYRNPLPPIPRTHPAIGKLRGAGSLSIGTTRDGIVVRCRLLPPEGEHHRVLPVQSLRGTQCGTDELVAAILKAADDVARAVPGSILPVGNIGREGGGDIIWSISHNSGRDADLGFFLVGPDGRQVIPRELIPLDRQGRTTVDDVQVRLDVKRTWLVAKSLLSNPNIEIQWLFLADGLKKMVLDYAKRRGEKRVLIDRLDAAMAQPARSRPHNDHIHLRIYCPRDDLLEGCQDRGTNRPWYVDRGDKVAARVAELMGLLGSKDPAERAGAATVLGRMGRTETLPRIAARLEDPDSRVRVAAAEAIREAGVSGIVEPVLRAVGTIPEARAAFALLQALDVDLTGQARAAVLGRLLGLKRDLEMDSGVFAARWKVHEWALDALSGSVDADSVAVLVAALGKPDVDAEAVAGRLKEMTGFIPEGSAGDLPAAWQAWWAKHRRLPPVRWHDEALRTEAFLGHGPTPADFPDLLRLLKAGDWRARVAMTGLRIAWKGRFPKLPPDGIEPFGILVERVVAVPEPEAPATTADTSD
jgi:penicillin-insensitive murein endopeptidase